MMIYDQLTGELIKLVYTDLLSLTYLIAPRTNNLKLTFREM